MRRAVALLLSLLMVIGLLPDITLYAETNIELTSLLTRLTETTTGVDDSKPIGKDDEEATMQWDITNGGEYKLTYYTEAVSENPGDTTRIEVTFQVGKGLDEDNHPESNFNAMICQVKAYTSDDKLIENMEYQDHIYGYTGVYGAVQKGNFQKQMGRPIQNVTPSTKELSIIVGQSVKIIVKGKDNKLMVWTNGISKGNITDFTLTYGEKSTSQIVFRGLAGLEISPTELKESDNDLSSTTKVYGPGEVTSEKPGIKVAFQRPKKRDSTSKTFKSISVDEGKNLTATINLYTVLEPSDKNRENEIQVIFNLGGSNDDTEIVNGGTLSGDIIDQGKLNKVATLLGSQVAVYFSKEDTYVKQEMKEHVVTWPTLSESMLIGGTVRLEGELDIYTEQGNKKKSLKTGDVSFETGYTYIKYIPTQSKVGETSLDITPYKYTGEITYKIYKRSGDGEINESTDLQGSYPRTYDPAYPDDTFSISVPSREKATYVIKAVISPDNPFYSQLLIYNPKDESVMVKPSIPLIRDVNDIYVIPEKDEQGKLESAGFNLVWSAPSKADLLEALGKKDDTKAELYYELYLYNSARTEKSLLGVVKITSDKSSDNKTDIIKAMLYQGENVIEVDYNETDNLFTANKVKLKDLEQSSWTNLVNAREEAKDTLKDYPELEQFTQKQGLSYKVPGTYYLTMKAILDSKKDTIHLNEGDESNFYSLTLDVTTEIVPVPHSINGTVALSENIGQQISFNTVSIQRFYQFMLEPGKWNLTSPLGNNLELPGTYEIYLYQETYLNGSNKEENKQSDTELSQLVEKMEQVEVDEKVNQKVIDYECLSETGTLTNKSNKVSVNNELISGKSIVEALREGKIVKMDYSHNPLNGKNIDEKLQFTLTDLDPNQTYHIRIRLRLDRERKLGENEVEIGRDYSLFSKAYGFTATTQPKPPTSDENTPPAPKEFTAVADDNSSATLNWKDPDFTPEKNDWSKVSYEIIRVTDTKINDNLLEDRSESIASIIRKLNRLDLVTFDKDDYGKVSKEELEVNELKDTTLRPNTIYYYYIRTVYNGQYSEWIKQPITTDNIEPPMNLEAVKTDKNTATISFYGKAPLGEVTRLYDFEIMIQSEESPNWEPVSEGNKSLITQHRNQTPEGYTYYEYKITGLKPGKRYNIKVCMLDMTKEMIDGNYQKSLYSNTIYIRTEYDEEEQMKDNKYEEYLEKFNSEVEKLRRRAYWVVEAGEKYKYRENYIKTGVSLEKEYELVSEEKADALYYYLPASIMVGSEATSATIKIVLDSQSISIRANTLLEEHQAIKTAIEKISSNEIEDYYIGIEGYTRTATDKINGQSALSPQISIEMELVYMKQEDELTEDDIMIALNKIVDDEREDFISKLEKKVYNGTIADDVLTEFIEGYIEDIEDDHAKEVKRIMERYTRKMVSLSELNKSLLIISKVDAFAVDAYYYQGGWVSTTSYQVGNGFAIEAAQFGIYLFTGQADLISTVPSLAPYQGFISKYNLTDFFMLDSYMIQTATTKTQIYGAVARLLGAQRGTDYSMYLKNKGIKGVVSLGLNSAIRQDEMIYIVMQAYEKLYNRPVSSVVIKNKQSVQNIGAFQTIYRDYVYAAVELKIIQPVNNKVIPSKQMTVEETIKVLYKVQVS